MFSLGDRVKDKITGMTGIATGRCAWLYGCVRYAVQPEKLDKDNKSGEPVWFDEPQLLLVKAAAVPGRDETEAAPKAKHGPRNDPKR